MIFSSIIKKIYSTIRNAKRPNSKTVLTMFQRSHWVRLKYTWLVVAPGGTVVVVKDYCHTLGSWPLLFFTMCFILLKTKDNTKNTLLALIIVKIRQNNRKFVKDCFVIRWTNKIFHYHVPDIMAISNKSSAQYHSVILIL